MELVWIVLMILLCLFDSLDDFSVFIELVWIVFDDFSVFIELVWIVLMILVCLLSWFG